jgi:predicted nucleotidyltransferase
MAEIESCAKLLADAASSPARVMIFGSYARGGADEHSDLDFLVIEQDVASAKSESVLLRESLPPLGVAVDVIVVSEAQAMRRAQVKGSLIANALAEGLLLAQS